MIFFCLLFLIWLPWEVVAVMVGINAVLLGMEYEARNKDKE